MRVLQKDITKDSFEDLGQFDLIISSPPLYLEGVTTQLAPMVESFGVEKFDMGGEVISSLISRLLPVCLKPQGELLLFAMNIGAIQQLTHNSGLRDKSSRPVELDFALFSLSRLAWCRAIPANIEPAARPPRPSPARRTTTPPKA